MERISSPLTVFFKFVFPTMWSLFFGLGTLGVFLRPALDTTRLVVPLVWLGGSAVLFGWLGRLKRVDIAEDCLVVSNYFRQVSVPLNHIVDVVQHLDSGRTISIYFDIDTGFGPSIHFMPNLTARLFAEYPVVGRLRSLAGLNRARPA